MGAAGRANVTSLYTLERLVADHAALYDELLASRMAHACRIAHDIMRRIHYQGVAADTRW